jgi:aspartate beta-hydroxylase
MKPDARFFEQLEAGALSTLVPTPIEDRPLRGEERLALVQDMIASGRLPRSTQVGRAPAFFYPGLPSQPFYDPETFAWTPEVLARRTAFAEDLAALERRGEERRAFHSVWPDFTETGEWAALWIELYGEPYDDNARLCAGTLAALESVSGRSGWLGFSALAPHTHVRPHCGITNAKLRCHVAVELCPGMSRIRVGDAVRTWEQGRMLVFDDSFEHEVWNDSDARRVVLIFDVFHPDLMPMETAFLTELEARTVRRTYGELMRIYRARSGELAWLGRHALAWLGATVTL